MSRDSIEVTSISSRGQVVIPQALREKLRIREGEKFIVIGEGNTVILKKLEMPSFNGIDVLLEKTRSFARKHSLKESDVGEAIKKARER